MSLFGNSKSDLMVFDSECDDGSDYIAGSSRDVKKDKLNLKNMPKSKSYREEKDWLSDTTSTSYTADVLRDFCSSDMGYLRSTSAPSAKGSYDGKTLSDVKRSSEKLSSKKESESEIGRDSYYDKATTLSCDEKRFTGAKKPTFEPPLLELSSEDRRFYRTFRKMNGIKYTDLEYVPLNPKLDPPPKRCFSCWARGHYSRICPNPLIALFCRNCGRRDVDLADCPRCAKAHKREMEKRDTMEALKDVLETKKKPDPLLDTSMFVNEGSIAGDPPRRRRPLSMIGEEYEFTSDMIGDVKDLMDAVKHLSVKTQDRVLRQWLNERQKN